MLPDVSSDLEHSRSERGYNSDQSNNLTRNTNSIRTNVVNQSGNQVETNDNIKLFKDLGKELEKAESVAKKVDDTLIQVVISD